MRRILLAHLPLADAIMPNLAIELLAELARAADEPCDTFHGSLMTPVSLPFNVIHGSAGPGIFTPHYFDISEEQAAEELAQVAARIGAQHGDILSPEQLEELTTDYLIYIDQARTMIDDCLAAIPTGTYDVIGISVIFDAQKLPSIALAKHLKEREPHLKILFGGTGCDGDMAAALVECFLEIDAAVHDDAEQTFLDAVAALRGEIPFAKAANCAYRTRDGKVSVSPPQLCQTRLDALPTPDYTAYMKAREDSVHKDRSRLILPFETSRGCWWGQKQHCKFCGILAVERGFRTRSTPNAIAQIDAYRERYQPDTLYATDAILGMEHLETLMPALAYARRSATGKKPDLFYETKSNLKRREVALLAASGVCEIQPGIESFSTATLKRVNKGTTALQQVQLLKWATLYGVNIVYGLMYGTPGETVEEVDAACALMARLHHLCPPAQGNLLALHKFSPYHRDPARYGFSDIRPSLAQRVIYRTDDETLLRLCYEHDYTLAGQDDPALRQAHQRLKTAIAQWREAYYSGTRWVMGGSNDNPVMIHKVDGGVTGIHRLSPLAVSVLAHGEQVTTARKLAQQMSVALGEVEDTICELVDEGIVVSADGQVLNVTFPNDVDVWRDAGLNVDEGGRDGGEHGLSDTPSALASLKKAQ